MSGFLTKRLLTSLFLAGVALPALAQNPSAPVVDTASAPPTGLALAPELLSPPAVPAPAASGLALAPPVAQQPVAVVTPPVAQAPVELPVASKSAPLPDAVAPVTAVPLPNVSPETVGTSLSNGLGADMWKGTPRVVAEKLVSIITPTASAELNELARRLLATVAAPPEGDDNAAKNLTSLRIEKLVAFGAVADAWTLAKHADAKLVDDTSFHVAAENALIDGTDEVCAQTGDLVKTRASADWQKLLIVCQLRAKDSKAAQVALDVLRTQNNRDNVFLGIADKNVLGTAKALPFQLTPLTAPSVALLQLANLPVPSEALGHPDVASIPALLTIPAQQDVAKLALAERAAERGAISIPALETVYRSIPFSPEALTGALTSSESGLRLHALLFHASEGENDPAKRIALATKFLQTATPAFSNGAGYVAADMLGAIKTDPALSANAVAVTRIYMLAGRGDAALDWLRLAQGNAANAEALLLLWPQFALAGLEAEGNFAADFDKWLEAMLKLADTTTTEGHAPREVAASTLLLLDSAGFKIPDSAWAKVLSAERNEKHIAFDPALWERLQAAASANRRAETVLLAVALAGDGDISIPEAVAITRALHNAGFKSEAAIFARQAVAPLVKLN